MSNELKYGDVVEANGTLYVVAGWYCCSNMVSALFKLLIMSECVSLIPLAILEAGSANMSVSVAPVRILKWVGNRGKDLDLYMTKQAMLGNNILYQGDDYLPTRKEFLAFRKEMMNSFKDVYNAFIHIKAGNAFQVRGTISYYMGMRKEDIDSFFNSFMLFSQREPSIFVQYMGTVHSNSVSYLLKCSPVTVKGIEVDKNRYVDFSYIKRNYL